MSTFRHKEPCNECPWRRKAIKGWLGGNPAIEYADAVNNNEVPSCHLRDFGADSAQSSMCAGALAVMANACILPHAQKEIDATHKVGKRKDCFTHPREFYKHHTGKDYVSRFMRPLEVDR